MTTLFISWSGAKSNELALALREWLPHVLQTVTPWMSKSDIEAGTYWDVEIHKALKKARFGIVCLTEKNYQSPWVNYEVGFLSRTLPESICAYLFGVKMDEISGLPIARCQAMTADKVGTLGLLKAINNNSKRKVPVNVLERSFALFWPELEQTLKYLSDEKKLEGAKELVALDLSHRRPQQRDPSLFTLSVSDPLSYSRKAHATTDWQPIDEATKVTNEWLLVQDEEARPVPAQVDLIDPEDPASAVLVFSLNRKMSASLSDGTNSQTFVTIEKGKQLRSAPDEANTSVEPKCEFLQEERRVKLSNSRMEVLLELNPAPWDPQRDWYAGSVSSVRLDQVEMLDYYREAIRLTDYERRCMLIDRLQIQTRGRKAALDEQLEQRELIKEPYELVSESSGPVRASVTILSQPVLCDYWDLPDQKGHPVEARLRRVISLYRDANYIFEEIKIIPLYENLIQDKDVGPILFSVRYFSYIDFGAATYETDNVLKWWTVSTAWPPKQCYAFASDKRPGNKVDHKDPAYSGDDQLKTFSWYLTTSDSAKCIHLFRMGEPVDLEAEIEKEYIEQIQKPLTVKIQEQVKDGARRRY